MILAALLLVLVSFALIAFWAARRPPGTSRQELVIGFAVLAAANSLAFFVVEETADDAKDASSRSTAAAKDAKRASVGTAAVARRAARLSMANSRLTHQNRRIITRQRKATTQLRAQTTQIRQLALATQASVQQAAVAADQARVTALATDRVASRARGLGIENRRLLSKIEREGIERRRLFCEDRFGQQEEKRKLALETFRSLPALLRSLPGLLGGIPDEVLIELSRQRLLLSLRGGGRGVPDLSNKPIPEYCPQHNRPVPIPPDVRTASNVMQAPVVPVP